MVGFSLFLVSVVFYFIGARSTKVKVLILALIISWYIPLTYARNFDWIDGITLWSDVIAKSPSKSRPYFSRGTEYAHAGKHKEALYDFNKCLMMDYEAFGIKEDYAMAYDKLLGPKKDYSEVYNFLGAKYAEINKTYAALILFGIAIRTSPANINAYANLIAAYGDEGKFKEAINIGKKALELNPESAVSHYNLAVAYYLDKQYGLAIKHLGIARRLGFAPDPEFVRKLEDNK